MPSHHRWRTPLGPWLGRRQPRGGVSKSCLWEAGCLEHPLQTKKICFKYINGSATYYNYSYYKVSPKQYTYVSHSSSLSICTFPFSLDSTCTVQSQGVSPPIGPLDGHIKVVTVSLSPQGAISDQERKKMKRKGDRYTMQTSLIVATLKRMLPVGLNICAPGDQELIALAKNRFTQVLHPEAVG